MAYQVCNQNLTATDVDGNLTVKSYTCSAQQTSMLQQRGRRKTPREAFVMDLQALSSWKNNNNNHLSYYLATSMKYPGILVNKSQAFARIVTTIIYLTTWRLQWSTREYWWSSLKHLHGLWTRWSDGASHCWHNRRSHVCEGQGSNWLCFGFRISLRGIETRVLGTVQVPQSWRSPLFYPWLWWTSPVRQRDTISRNPCGSQIYNQR